MTLRADRLMAGAAAEIAALAADLRAIEAALAPVLSGLPPSAVVQQLDSVLQRLDGLALVLAAEAAHVPATLLPGAAARIEALRLAQLAGRLLGTGDEGALHGVELF
ncbi:hypothetical protein [Paragemmobacter straminiformis]|uniref:Uncharacterized protein n=1 Tax=Paragemmobacter straminiformis TaxID=2045119 RepID=A0A842IAX4_9RHOB|nr:hypothetical protein [Gemmobacter straminiformis]MBC2836739.1 hypothetical protein [Gemmobacter straminiformis]